jgi:hypothetical protein
MFCLPPLRHGGLRIGIFGWPRRERLTEMAMAAFAESRRGDLQLAVFMRGPKQQPPNDPRIFAPLRTDAFLYSDYVDALATVDVFLLPMASTGMLTSGIAAHPIEASRPALISQWPYLHEYLGDLEEDGLGIPYRSARDLTQRLDALDYNDIIPRAEQNAPEMRKRLHWGAIADEYAKAYTLACDIGPVRPNRSRVSFLV